MRLSGAGAILCLFPFFLGCLSLVAASPSDPDVVGDANDLLRGKRCVKPHVRREWRALSDGERAEWIGAVKVSLCLDESGGPLSSLGRPKCLAKVPHKEYVVPYPNHVNYTVDVPLLKNSSMFDGVYACPAPLLV